MNKKPFSVITKGKLTIPVIAHVPHSSTFIPKDVRHSLVLSDIDLKKELILMTDCYTSELFSGITALGGLTIVNNYGRLVVDPERFENDEEDTGAEIIGVSERPNIYEISIEGFGYDKRCEWRIKFRNELHEKLEIDNEDVCELRRTKRDYPKSFWQHRFG